VVFRTSSSVGTIGLSHLWLGNVSSTGPPSVTGAVRANSLVTPVAGQWNGGWEGDYDRFELAACASPDGTGCTTLTHLKYPSGCPGDAAVIDPKFTGDFLRVADRRFPQDGVSTAEAVGSPYGHSPWAANAITSVAIVGRIAPKTGKRQSNCGPPPLVDPFISKKGVGFVQCLGFCRAVLVGRHGDEVAKTDNRRPGSRRANGIQRLRLKPKSLDRLGPGRVRFTLLMNGKRVARRTVVLD
jgi:hypothetical protein